LSAAVSRARDASPRRRAAALVAEGAQDAARAAGRLPNPLFEMRTENWSHSTRSSTPDLDVFAVVAQPIELGNKRAIRRHLAFADRDVAESAVGSLERELALETVGAYIRGLKARALVWTLGSNREGLAAIIETMARRVEEGYCAEADLLKFRTEAARVDGDIARARLELERSLAALTIAIGSTEPVVASQLVDPAPLDAPSGSAELIAARIARHPDVVAAGASVDRATQLTAYERARRLPEPLVTGGYKRTSGFNTAVFGVTVALPVFDRNDASIARAVAAERAAAADRDALVLRLTQDTAALIRAAETIGARARQAQTELLAPADDVRRAARAAFREGTADVLQLIDAERVYADVHRAAIELRLDALQIAIEARFAIGEESIP
jgi:cobalt-zinc-cadmium efflux system outer membrane protein